MIEYLSDIQLAFQAYSYGTTQVALVKPDLADSVTVNSSTSAWTYGSWTEIVAASVLPNCMLTHFQLGDNAAFSVADYQIQFGVGGAGAEVTITNTALLIRSSVGAQLVSGPIPLPFPARIAINSRVAARLTSGTAATESLGIKCLFVPTRL